MASNEQAKIFTVPVGTRLSHGVELELLVAYLFTSDDCPDEPNDLNLPPILRIDSNGLTISGRQKDAVAVRRHVRTTLRDHGIRVHNEVSEFNEDLPLHVESFDSWAVDVDSSVAPGEHECALTARRPGNYKWFGLELRSRIFWDVEHAYDEMRFVVNLLKAKYRVRVNTSCGFHVHVANGAKYFDTTTLKRAGAFLWAADPMLSRLHAPWRRIGEYSTSIRYRSRLAHNDGVKPADTQQFIDRAAARLKDRSNGTMTMDPLPVLPWSDTSMEEAELGGRIAWEAYARERIQNGPFMEVPERLPSPHGRGAYDRLFQSVIVSDRMRARCYKRYRHGDTRALSPRAQYQLFLIEACQQLFGHSEVEALSDEEYEDLICECAPYTQTIRSHYTWDDANRRFRMNKASIGKKVEGPRARKYNEKEKSLAVVRLQALVEAQDKGEIPDDQVPDYATDDEEDLSGDVDDLERFLMNRLDQLMEQPTFPLHCVDRLIAEVKKLKEYAGTLTAPAPPADEHSDDGGESSDVTPDSSGDFNPSAFRALEEGLENEGPTLPRPPSPSGSANLRSPSRRSPSDGELGDSDKSSDESPDSSGAFNPAAFRALDEGRENEDLIMPRPSSSRYSPSDRKISDGNKSSDVSLGSSGNFNPSAFRALDEGFEDGDSNLPSSPSPSDSADLRPPNRRSSSDRELGLRGGSSNGITNGSSPMSTAYDPSKDPAFFEFRGSSSSFRSSLRSLPPYNSGTNPPTGTTSGSTSDKIQPHDVSKLPAEYIKHITDAAYLTIDHWHRASWLPDPNPNHPKGRGPEDPMEHHVRHSAVCAGPECQEHIVTTTRGGIDALLACDTAAAVGTLLVAPGENGFDDELSQRLNYNFKAYAAYTLAGTAVSAEKRTIEFREAGGSLDAEWIVTWSKICVGILKFCRDSKPAEYVRVLERVVKQEDRTRDGGSVRYDVADLLEDLCLFGEAAIVRRRERELGPPR